MEKTFDEQEGKNGSKADTIVRHEKEGGNDQPPPSSIWSPAAWKRAHLFWLSLCVEFYYYGN